MKPLEIAMKSYTKYYEEELYPLQDGILKIVKDLKLPFYLTGGTALSRYYFQHRYSDDLDLFVNADQSYLNYITAFADHLLNDSSGYFKFIPERFIKSENYTQIYVEYNLITLKIDIVNDVKFHFGDFIEDKTLGRVDAWRNILSNKIAAAYRLEIKDFVDIWIICKNQSFNWVDIFNESKYKDPGVDPISLSNLFKSFPFENLNLIKWIITPNIELLKREFFQIADDILYGKDNSLEQK